MGGQKEQKQREKADYDSTLKHKREEKGKKRIPRIT